MGIRIKNEEEQTVFDSVHPDLPGDYVLHFGCGDCAGTGYIPGLEMVQNGICFRCNGTGGKYTRTVQEEREREVRRYRDQLFDLRKKQERLALKEEWKTANKELVYKVRCLPEGWGADTATSIISSPFIPSEKQVALLHKIVDQQDKWDAEEMERRTKATVVPTGTQTITGKVLSYKEAFSQWGNTIKITVEDDRGFRVFGTLPSSIDSALYNEFLQFLKDEKEHGSNFGPLYYVDGIKGQRVTFTATIEPSDDDTSFGFFKRPRNAELLQAQTV